MEPRIEYARTEDGVNIAFWTLRLVECCSESGNGGSTWQTR